MNKESDSFLDDMMEYNSKCIFIKNLFWSRIENAIKIAEIEDDDRILDIGCNTGQLLKSIRRMNQNCECYGIDVEPKITEVTIEKCILKIADAKKLPFPDNHFSVIFVLDVLEHIEDVGLAINEINRVLKPNGSLILSGPTETWFYRLCRFLSYRTADKNTICEKPGFRRLEDHHLHTIYQLEKMLLSKGFKRIKTISLPRFLPELFRITKFVK